MSGRLRQKNTWQSQSETARQHLWFNVKVGRECVIIDQLCPHLLLNSIADSTSDDALFSWNTNAKYLRLIQHRVLEKISVQTCSAAAVRSGE